MADAKLSILIQAKDEASRTLAGFASQAASFAAGLGIFEVAKTGISAVAGFLKESAEEARGAETQLALYTQVLKQASGATEDQVRDLKAQADAMKALGGVSGDVVMQTQATLATFDLKAESIKRLTPALTDLIAQEYKFGATEDNARSIGNAFGLVLQGNVGALSRYGFKFDEATEKILKNGTETQKITALTEILNSTYEGANAALAATSEGGMQRLNEQLKDIKENIGTFILPLTDAFMQRVVQITGMIAEWTNSLGSVNGAIGNLQSFFGNLITTFDEKTGIITALRDAFNEIWAQISAELIPALRELWEANKPLLPYWQALGKLIATVLVIGIRLFIEVVKTLVSWLIQLATFMAKVQTALLNATKFAIEPMTKVVNGLTDAIKGAVQWFKNMAAWSETARNKASAALKQIPLVGGLASKAITGRAIGGPVSSGRPYIVGEEGPELFVPRSSGTIVPNDRLQSGGQQGPIINITLNGDVVDRPVFIREITEAVNRAIAAPNTLQAW